MGIDRGARCGKGAGVRCGVRRRTVPSCGAGPGASTRAAGGVRNVDGSARPLIAPHVEPDPAAITPPLWTACTVDGYTDAGLWMKEMAAMLQGADGSAPEGWGPVRNHRQWRREEKPAGVRRGG